MLDAHLLLSDLIVALGLVVVFEKRVIAAIRAGRGVLAELGLF